MRIGLVAGALLLMAAAPDVNGLWLTEDGSGVVAIAPCDGGECGKLVGFRDQPPPKDFQGVSECGLEFIHPMTIGTDGKLHGAITDPSKGDEYHAMLEVSDDGKLRLRGYLGISLFGQTQVWNRFSGSVSADCRINQG